MTFSYTLSQETDNIIIVSLAGRLIEKNQAISLIAEVDSLIESEPLRLIIEMSELEYMNSSGLNILITLLTKARKTGGEAILANEPEMIKKLLVITKLNQVFIVSETKDQALELLRKEGLSN